MGNVVCPSVSHRRRSRSQNRTDTSFHRPLPNPKNRCAFLSKRRSAREPKSPSLSNALDSHRPSLELQRSALAPWLLSVCDCYTPTSTPLLPLNKPSREFHIGEAVPRHVVPTRQ
jgi:hypothetical protein